MDNNVLTFHKQNDKQCKVMTEKLQTSFLLVTCLLLLYAFLWVIPRRLNFICRRFRTLCLFHLHRWMGVKYE